MGKLVPDHAGGAGQDNDGVITTFETNPGADNGNPSGCTWHRFGNVQLFTSPMGDNHCLTHGYDGCHVRE